MKKTPVEDDVRNALEAGFDLMRRTRKRNEDWLRRTGKEPLVSEEAYREGEDEIARAALRLWGYTARAARKLIKEARDAEQ